MPAEVLRVTRLSDGTYPERPEGYTRFVCLSDTHGLHNRADVLKVPDGDVLVYAGDAGLAAAHHVPAFNKWLQALPHAHKVVTFGNMDFWAEASFERSALPAAHHVLLDSVADVAGFRVFGSPFTPAFYGSFQLDGPDAARRHWETALPVDDAIDILVTHGPPRGAGDVTQGRHVGDEELLRRVAALPRPPLLWVVGHIHSSYGWHEAPHPGGAVPLANVATNDLRTGRDTVPIVVDVRRPGAVGASP